MSDKESDMNKKHVLVGKTITGIKLASDKEAILFQTTDGDVIAKCYADCCSETWIENIENTIREFPALVMAAEDIKDGLPEPVKDDPEHDYLQFYGFKITTDKGLIVIDYRNASNGYYGGWLEWPGDSFYRHMDDPDAEWEVVA